ncbi:hypothetical protein [Sciscionella sediminilitoris]|uniref:hypothetical protein n=1 Tax=Sciscionella sediminilitoris TaxID=1445613 RepID=UPI0004DFA5F0|nr:hypothetical protein [Sciscionella sp. SE31]
MIEIRPDSTALNKFKSVQQFFNYLVEEEMREHPMARHRRGRRGPADRDGHRGLAARSGRGAA